MYRGDIRPGELRQVLRHLEGEEDGYAVQAVVEATGVEAARVVRALAGIRAMARARLAAIAVLLAIGSTMVAVVATTPMPEKADPRQERTLEPARLR